MEITKKKDSIKFYLDKDCSVCSQEIDKINKVMVSHYSEDIKEVVKLEESKPLIVISPDYNYYGIITHFHIGVAFRENGKIVYKTEVKQR